MSGIRGVSGLLSAHSSVLTASVDVYRKASVADTSGGSTDTYTLTHTYPCNYRLNQFTPRERESGVRIQEYVYWDFVLAPDVDIRPTDRLYVGTRRFEVVGGGASSLSIFAMFTCLEIQ